MFSILLVALFAGLTFSCQKDLNQVQDSSQPILGSWIIQTYQDSVTVFEKASDLKSNSFGISFKDNGSLIERKNAGWCATPPVSCADYNGTWAMKDSIIQISVDYWGGKAEYRWKLISIDNNKLKIVKQFEKYTQTTN